MRSYENIRLLYLNTVVWVKMPKITVDEQTERFAQIYQAYAACGVLTEAAMGPLYALLDDADFLTFGPF